MHTLFYRQPLVVLGEQLVIRVSPWSLVIYSTSGPLTWIFLPAGLA